jgi:hypothetical protein
MTSPVSGLKETRLSRGSRLEKIMKSRTRTNKASLQSVAARTALLLTFAVSLITSGLVLSAKANEQKTAIITITAFDVPGAGKGSGQGTFAFNINPAGAIAGDIIDANNVIHGFVRAPNGAITTFDAPGAGTGSGQGTFPSANNPPGAIVGSFLDASNAYHGFLMEGE